MSRILYTDFLSNEESYRASEKFWEDMVNSMAATKDQFNEWRPWMARTYGDGITPLPRDGNPIWDAYSRKLDRAIRIIQHASDSGHVSIGAWVKVEKEDDNIDLPRVELVIHLILSEIARKLLSKWMEPKTTIDDIESYITTVLGNT